MENLLELSYVTISYVAEKKCLVQTWKKFCTTDQYKETQEKCLEFIIAKGGRFFISDTTNAGLLKAEATDWAVAELIPKLIAEGVGNVEIVLPKSVFAKMSLLNIEKVTSAYLRYYGSLESALANI